MLKKSAISLYILLYSYTADLVFGVTGGKVITAKHFLLATGLHNITGSKKVIEITSRLGHSLDYLSTCDIETAQARKMQVLDEEVSILPLKPKDSTSLVRTFFWVDNFDVTVEKASGGGSVNTTHLVAFQEIDENTVSSNVCVSVDRIKSHRLLVDNNLPTFKLQIDKKKDPDLLPDINLTCESIEMNIQYFVWLLIRKCNGMSEYIERNDQIVPNFEG